MALPVVSLTAKLVHIVDPKSSQLMTVRMIEFPSREAIEQVFDGSTVIHLNESWLGSQPINPENATVPASFVAFDANNFLVHNQTFNPLVPIWPTPTNFWLDPMQTASPGPPGCATESGREQTNTVLASDEPTPFHNCFPVPNCPTLEGSPDGFVEPNSYCNWEADETQALCQCPTASPDDSVAHLDNETDFIPIGPTQHNDNFTESVIPSPEVGGYYFYGPLVHSAEIGTNVIAVDNNLFVDPYHVVEEQAFAQPIVDCSAIGPMFLPFYPLLTNAFPVTPFPTFNQQHQYYYENVPPPPLPGRVTPSDFTRAPSLPIETSSEQLKHKPTSQDTVVKLQKGSLFVENPICGISVCLLADGLDFSYSHPLFKLKKVKGVIYCYLTFTSGVRCFVKLSSKGIRFSRHKDGMAYLMDEAGVRTCLYSFDIFGANVTSNMWKSNPFLRGECEDKAFKMIRKPAHTEYLSFPADKSICIKRNGWKFYSDTGELSRLNLNFAGFSLSSSLRHSIKGWVGNIRFKNDQHRYSQRLSFDGSVLRMKFHTQTAGFDKCGKLSLSL